MEHNVLSWLFDDEEDKPMDIPKGKYVKATPIIESMGYHGTVLGAKEIGRKTIIKATGYPCGKGLGFIETKKMFAKDYCVVDSDSDTKEELFEILFQYIEDDLDIYVLHITESDLSSLDLPLTNPKLIDWDQQDSPPSQMR